MYNSTMIGAYVQSFYELQPGNETLLKIAVASIGPISAAMDASVPTFQLYKSGTNEVLYV